MRIVERFAVLGRKPAAPAADDGRAAPAVHAHGLEERVAHLESELEALQDQLHRESQRRDREVAELQRQLRPADLARNLSDDSRRRGL